MQLYITQRWSLTRPLIFSVPSLCFCLPSPCCLFNPILLHLSPSIALSSPKSSGYRALAAWGFQGNHPLVSRLSFAPLPSAHSCHVPQTHIHDKDMMSISKTWMHTAAQCPWVCCRRVVFPVVLPAVCWGRGGDVSEVIDIERMRRLLLIKNADCESASLETRAAPRLYSALLGSLLSVLLFTRHVDFDLMFVQGLDPSLTRSSIRC